MSEFTDKLAMNMATGKEKLIKAAITHQVGNNQWSISDISGRGEFKILPDKTEIFAFDGVDLIHFGIIETVIDDAKVDIYATAMQKYRLLYS